MAFLIEMKPLNKEIGFKTHSVIKKTNLHSNQLSASYLFLFIYASTVSFTDLDQGREILSRFSLPKSMKHSVCHQFIVT
jgi:hypothetical protein